jgi:hypothetical protein
MSLYVRGKPWSLSPEQSLDPKLRGRTSGGDSKVIVYNPDMQTLQLEKRTEIESMTLLHDHMC